MNENINDIYTFNDVLADIIQENPWIPYEKFPIHETLRDLKALCKVDYHTALYVIGTDLYRSYVKIQNVYPTACPMNFSKMMVNEYSKGNKSIDECFEIIKKKDRAFFIQRNIPL
jgi:hypothetical protein